MSRHLWREVGRQLAEAKGTGFVAVALLAVGGAWTLSAAGLLSSARMALAKGTATAVVACVVRSPEAAGELVRLVGERFPACRSRLIEGEAVASALSSWVAGNSRPATWPPMVEVLVPQEGAQEVTSWLAARPEVQAAQASTAWTPRARAVLAQALRLVALLSAVLAVAFASLVVLTVRVLVLSHADEIAILRLIGAHEGAIRTPYLVAHGLLGLAGGAGAVALAWGVHGLVRPILPWDLPAAGWLVGTAGAGALLGTLGAAVGLRSLPPEP